MYAVYVRGTKAPLALRVSGAGGWRTSRFDPRTGKLEVADARVSSGAGELRAPDEQDWAFLVQTRTHEIGVRMALGASARDVFKLIVGRGMKLTIAGVAVGVVGAIALTRLMHGLLFNTSTTDPMVFIIISALLSLAAFLACYIPARRAAKVDPLIALRYE